MSRSEWGDNGAFCVIPWLYLHLLSHGSARACCKIPGQVTDDGVEMSIYERGVEDIWNSDYIREMRGKMVSGEAVAACVGCYREEASGGFSMRLARNRGWLDGELRYLNEEHAGFNTLKSRAIVGGYRLVEMPSYMQLDVGNLCNLKCRMCQGWSSSQIDRDEIHRKWNGGAPPDERLDSGKHWYEDAEFLRTKVFVQPERLRLLQILGGEPLIIKGVGTILQCLIDAGVADNVELLVATNGSTSGGPWMHIAEQFKLLSLNVSLDGFGKYYDYIRYPGKWANVIANIENFKNRPKTCVLAIVTIQAYNILNLVELFAYLDSVGVPFYGYPVTHPPYLSPAVLPQSVRNVAAERLRKYADSACLEQNRELVLGIAGGIEQPAAAGVFDEELLHRFMLFTNDLDRSRGQSFRSTHEELSDLLAQSGFAWTDETRFFEAGAPAMSQP